MKEVPGLPDLYAVEESDLAWFKDTVASLTWTNARSYQDSIPHEYVFPPRPGSSKPEQLTKADYYRLVRVIRAYGAPRQFNGSVNINFEPGDGRSYFCTDLDTEAVGNIQRGDERKFYGRQTVPRTQTIPEQLTERDAISGIVDLRDIPQFDGTPAHRIANYGRRQPTAHERKVAAQPLADALLEMTNGESFTTLDVGCGTGRILDTGVPPVALYTGIDSSRGMLNELLMKHPRVTKLIPLTGPVRKPRKSWGVVHIDASYGPTALPFTENSVDQWLGIATLGVLVSRPGGEVEVYRRG